MIAAADMPAAWEGRAPGTRSGFGRVRRMGRGAPALAFTAAIAIYAPYVAHRLAYPDSRPMAASLAIPDIVNVSPGSGQVGPALITSMSKDTAMATGTVKWFNATKGYGFIEPSDGGKDAFVHISAVERAGLTSLRDGQKVSYDLVPGQNGKASAENLTVED